MVKTANKLQYAFNKALYYAMSYYAQAYFQDDQGYGEGIEIYIAQLREYSDQVLDEVFNVMTASITDDEKIVRLNLISDKCARL